jgi:hypothetical protein
VTVKTGCLCGDSQCKGNAGKHPIGLLARHGLYSASTSPERIKRWWSIVATANIGIACGLSSLVVVDIDYRPDRDGAESWRKLIDKYGPRVEQTYHVMTGSGGRHLYYREPKDVALRSGSNALGLGIDLKTHGGYVIAPPSYHWSGNFYKAIGGNLKPFPKVLLRELQNATTHNHQQNRPIIVESDPEGVEATKLDLAKYLEQLRFRKDGWQATALCPAHDDHSPSLSLRVLPDGDVLFHCFAGCSFSDIMRALRTELKQVSNPSMRVSGEKEGDD